MTAINSVALTNTFDFQRSRLNEVITFVNTNAANNSNYVTNTVFQSTLANTNLAIADRIQVANAVLLINDRIQVANAATTYQTIAVERAALANTNSAIADRIQVANAAATYQTITVERAALANTNSYIASVQSSAATTGKAIAMAIVFG